MFAHLDRPDQVAPLLTRPPKGTPAQESSEHRRALPRAGMLRHRADRRTVLWSFGFFPLPIVVAFVAPKALMFLVPLTLYLGFSAGVLAHCHNHRAVFRSGAMNEAYGAWLSIFYGFPLFGWVPTHNQNHHKYVNGPLDDTRTKRMGKDTLLRALWYPLVSSRWQLPALQVYVRRLAGRSRRAARAPYVQGGALVVGHALVLGALLALHGAALGAVGYGLGMLLPALFASWSMMFINYLQHVDCDPTSPDNHSRNFVGSWENWLVFDAGLHTVHHENPGVHFSEYRRLHAERAGRIDPVLNQRNVLSFLVRRYFLRSQTDARSPLPEPQVDDSARLAMAKRH